MAVQELFSPGTPVRDQRKEHTMKHLLLSASLLLISFTAYGQTNSPPAQPCTLKIAQAPAVRGVKLGMTVDEVLPLFPGSSESGAVKQSLSTAEGYPNFGYAYFGLDPSSWGKPERFAGINSYFISTFDRRIVGLTVTYQQFPAGARWKNADDLIQRFSDALHLPGPNAWVSDSRGRKLQCDGFEIYVGAGESSSISFYTQGWEGTKRERLAAFEEQKRREFKP
jgi:hypothetical protein